MALSLQTYETEQLNSLSLHLAELGGLVEDQLSSALSAFERRDLALAQLVIDRDSRVNALDSDIEDFVMNALEANLFAGTQMREAVMMMRISNILERIGDISKNVAKRSLVISHEDAATVVHTVLRIGRIALQQLHDVLNAVRDRRVDSALAVWGGDQELDELYNSILQELLEMMVKDSRLVTACTHLSFTAKNFERIGDHTTNIAERIYYSLTGEKLKESRPKTDFASAVRI